MTDFTITAATAIDLGYDEDPLGNAYELFWNAVAPLPAGSVVAAGWPDALVYWRKNSTDGFSWTLLQMDPEIAENGDLEVGHVETADPNVLSCGGDIEVAYLVRRGE